MLRNTLFCLLPLSVSLLLAPGQANSNYGPAGSSAPTAGAAPLAETLIAVDHAPLPPRAAFNADEIIADKENRVAEEFKVPQELTSRVRFWFDVYTKYSNTEHVFHHVEYPWIIYEVVDVAPILNDNINTNNKWTNYHRSVRHLRERRAHIQKILLRLAKKRSFESLSDEEQKYFDLLKDVPGLQKKVFRHAAHQVRSQLGQKDFVLKGLQISGKYLFSMEKIFAEFDLPVELTRLPLVESSFNESAQSKVGASGIWQLMPPIGRKFLFNHPSVDERNSPIKSTHAAARLLRQNMQIMKSWPLAVTAYNHGTGGLLRAQRVAKSTDLTYLINHYRSASFGFASSNFFCSFLAVLHAERYYDDIFGAFEREKPIKFTAVVLKKAMTLSLLAKSLSLSVDELLSLNLDIKKETVRHNRRLPMGYKIFLPESAATELEALLKGKGEKGYREASLKF